jgi:hypothetical protein
LTKKLAPRLVLVVGLCLLNRRRAALKRLAVRGTPLVVPYAARRSRPPPTCTDGPRVPPPEFSVAIES